MAVTTKTKNSQVLARIGARVLRFRMARLHVLPGQIKLASYLDHKLMVPSIGVVYCEDDATKMSVYSLDPAETDALIAGLEAAPILLGNPILSALRSGASRRGV